MDKSRTATSAARAPQIMLPQPLADHPARTAYAGIDRNGFDRAIERAGAALHAGIPVNKRGLSIFDYKDLVRTHLNAPSATDASWLLQLKSDNITQISETFHGIAPNPDKHETEPPAT